MVESLSMTQVPLKTPAPPHGIITSLVTGFEAINARLELILLPLALDLWLWLGPHLSVSPLVPQIEAAMRSLMAAPATIRPPKPISRFYAPRSKTTAPRSTFFRS